MLASLDGDRGAALALFDRAQVLGDVLDQLGPLAALLDLGKSRKRRLTDADRCGHRGVRLLGFGHRP